MTSMKNASKNKPARKHHNGSITATLLLLSLLSLLSACGGTHNNSSFRLSNVSGLNSQRAGNVDSVSFTLSSETTIENAELTYSLVAIEDPTQTYTLGGGTTSLNRQGVSIDKVFLIPIFLGDGKYHLNVTIDVADGEQGVLTESQTLRIQDLDIFTPEEPELAIKSVKLNNNSFSLKTLPDDDTQIITERGDILLDLILQSKYKATTGEVSIEFDLNFEGVGEFPLNLTRQINLRDATGTDNHRNVLENGKVLERIKGNTRTVSERCASVNDVEQCVTIRKNKSRHFHVDLHLDEEAYNALLLHAQDVTGEIVVNIHADAVSEDIQYTLPVVYLHQDSDAILAKASSNFSAKRSPEEGNVDEVQTADSGDAEYIYHQTTSSANTFTDSDGQAYSEQSQTVSVSMGYQEGEDGQTFSLASMTTAVSSDKSEDVANTQFSMGLDSSGGTIWDFSEVAASAKAKSRSTAKSTTKTTDSYNPQEEIVWNYCSAHKDTCNVMQFVNGTVQVRYGYESSDQWKYKTVSDTVKCKTDIFGDPGSGDVKICQYMVPPSFGPRWERCAAEKGTCDLGNEEKVIRYGRNGHWNQLLRAGNVACDDATFGDPKNGEDKWCEIMTSSGSTPLNYEWKYCGDAKNEDICEVGSSAVVRLGITPGDAGGVFFSFRNVRDSQKCKGKFFGDPYEDTANKTCDYLSYIDPASRQDATDLIWSTKDDAINPDTSDESVTEVADEEKALVEAEFSESMSFRYYGITFEAEIEVAGVIGLKGSAFLDTNTKTFTMTGGPFVDIDSTATGKAYDELRIVEVGIKAPLAVLDIYSPFTVAFTIKPGTLTAELSLDYFIDLLAGEVILYYKYDLYPYSDRDEEVIYDWNYLYQTTDNLYQGSQTWELTIFEDYILPAIPDGFFERKIGFSPPIEGREYFLEISGTLANSEVWDAENPNEQVAIDIVCDNDIVSSMVFSGEISETISLGECSEVIISGIRAFSWAEENGVTFGVRDQW